METIVEERTKLYKKEFARFQTPLLPLVINRHNWRFLV